MIPPHNIPILRNSQRSAKILASSRPSFEKVRVRPPEYNLHRHGSSALRSGGLCESSDGGVRGATAKRTALGAAASSRPHYYSAAAAAASRRSGGAQLRRGSLPARESLRGGSGRGGNVCARHPHGVPAGGTRRLSDPRTARSVERQRPRVGGGVAVHAASHPGQDGQRRGGDRGPAGGDAVVVRVPGQPPGVGGRVDLRTRGRGQYLGRPGAHAAGRRTGAPVNPNLPSPEALPVTSFRAPGAG